MVECAGFAAVKFDAACGLCSCELGRGGTTVECLPADGGSYAVFPGGAACDDAGGRGACLRIDTDGAAVYYPSRRPDDAEDCDVNYYVMRHSSDVVVETVDSIGYHYVVTRTGDNHVGTCHAQRCYLLRPYSEVTLVTAVHI